jgi:hypothetical protein
MLASDTPAAFPAAKKVMPDRRVKHYWDSERAAGRWFKENVPNDYDKPILWDAFYLYGPDAVWKDVPAAFITSGRTILEDRRNLPEGLAKLGLTQ